MKQIYPYLNNWLKVKKEISSLCFALLATFLFNPSGTLSAQETYTLGEGTISSGTLGVSPFATININSRSQYIYYGVELQEAGAIGGYITAFALNITELAEPSDLYPENITIKMGQTFESVFGPSMVTGLQTVYDSAEEVITTTGWHTFVLETPFEWDGSQHIVVEICRSNTEFGTNFKVEAEQFGLGDYRTVGLYSNDPAIPGCMLTGDTPMSNASRRTRPNAQFTLAQICDGLPESGTAMVGAGPYCEGTPFTVGMQNSQIASGLVYQWQSSPFANGPWSNINGATAASYTGTQMTATYYRRQTTCDLTGDTATSGSVLVDGPGCYCEAPAETFNTVGIVHVGFSTINNFSASNFSYQYFDQDAEVEQSLTYNLTCNVNTAGGTNYTTAWIDWDNDGDFEASESYNLGTVTGGSNVNSGIVATVIVPANAVLGATQMRIRTQQSPANQAAGSCGDIVAGETEDYSLVVTEDLGIIDVDSPSSAVLVYGNGNGLNVKMRNADIGKVEVYDMSGRLLARKTGIDSMETVLPEFQGNRNILIVRITSTTGVVISKKVVL